MIKYALANVNLDLDLNTLSSPISAYMKITDACMLDCIFCSQKCAGKVMDLEIAKKALLELKKNSIHYVYYTGGEPLLHPQLSEILKFGKSLGFYQILVTNAILLSNRKNIKILDDVDALGVSLHGKESIHDTLSNVKGTYQKVIQSLTDIGNKYPQLPININCTLVRENTNEDNMKDLARFCKDRGYILSFARLNYINKGKNFQTSIEPLTQALQLISALKEDGYNVKISNCIAPCIVPEKYRHLLHGCSAGFGLVAIESNGDVKICPTSEYSLGNIQNKTLKKIWNSKELKLFRQLKWLPPQCTSCSSILTCKGGCHVENKGAFWKEISDHLVISKFERIWNEIKNKSYTLIPTIIRKDFKNYTIIHFPARSCSYEVIKILNLINDGNLLKDILEIYKGSEEIKNLLIALKLDGLLQERK